MAKYNNKLRERPTLIKNINKQPTVTRSKSNIRSVNRWVIFNTFLTLGLYIAIFKDYVISLFSGN